MEVPVKGQPNGAGWAETQRDSQTDRFSVEPPSEMVTLFLKQDTSPVHDADSDRRPCLSTQDYA